MLSVGEVSVVLNTGGEVGCRALSFLQHLNEFGVGRNVVVKDVSENRSGVLKVSETSIVGDIGLWLRGSGSMSGSGSGIIFSIT